jgi:hypothetical protein
MELQSVTVKYYYINVTKYYWISILLEQFLYQLRFKNSFICIIYIVCALEEITRI